MGQLPDGCQPDVLRGNLARRLLFLGDAKDTETPGCRATQMRLHRYFRWARCHTDNGGTTILAVCFGRRRDSAAWVRTLATLAAEVGIAWASIDVAKLTSENLLAWMIIRPPD